MLNDLTVILRTFDERSIDFCFNIISTEVDVKNIFIINESPFSQAVKKTFEIGISQHKKWTLAIDADLLLLPKAISIMLAQAQQFDKDIFVYQGLILDKLRCGLRQGGPHLYKTETLDLALAYLEQNELNLRPESAIYKKMAERGFKVIIDKKLYALHDFYQNFNDIYRKAYFHGIKHKGYKQFLPKWLAKGEKDNDYNVAALGFLDGYLSQNQKYPAKEELAMRVEAILLQQLMIKEKGKLEDKEVASLQTTINSFNINYNHDLEILYPKTSFLNKLKKKLFS